MVVDVVVVVNAVVNAVVSVDAHFPVAQASNGHDSDYDYV